MNERFKDWWFYVFWLFFIIIVIDIIPTMFILERWKWGYFHIDLIPNLIFLYLLDKINTIIQNGRLYKRIDKLEEDSA